MYKLMSRPIISMTMTWKYFVIVGGNNIIIKGRAMFRYAVSRAKANGAKRGVIDRAQLGEIAELFK